VRFRRIVECYNLTPILPAVVQNTFFTFDDVSSGCALNNSVYPSLMGPTGQPQDRSFAFVGNQVTGGRHGVLGAAWNYYAEASVADLLISGNRFALYPQPPVGADGPGAAATLWGADHLDLAGNTVAQADSLLAVDQACTNMLVLKNDSAAASIRSIDDRGTGGGLLSSQILKNRLGCGVSVHLRAPLKDGAHHFLRQNACVSTNGATTSLFAEPLALPIH